MNMKFLPAAVLLGVMFVGVKSCSYQMAVPQKKNIINIEAKSFSNALYYSGVIQPIKTRVIPCPTDGVIVEMPFQYGQAIKEGELLFMLSSGKFLSDYKTALMQYIKAKSDFNTSQTQLNEADFLHKNLLISDDDFNSKKSNFYASQLALLQAKDVLQNLIQQLDIKDANLYKLTIADIDKISEAMHLQMNSENLRINAPLHGVVLSATKQDDDAKKLMKGDAVKQGDVLAIVGDMSGLSVRIKVNELTVNQLKPGQKVIVTGIAFPEEVLNGEVSRVDRQGETSAGGLPVFPVEIIVPHLTEQQQNTIHAGMSAKVEINLQEEPQIMIPVGAVAEKNGNSVVTVVDSKGTQREVSVVTGKTTPDSVAILSGLKPGDHIVYSG